MSLFITKRGRENCRRKGKHTRRRARSARRERSPRGSVGCPSCAASLDTAGTRLHSQHYSTVTLAPSLQAFSIEWNKTRQSGGTPIRLSQVYIRIADCQQLTNPYSNISTFSNNFQLCNFQAILPILKFSTNYL